LNNQALPPSLMDRLEITVQRREKYGMRRSKVFKAQHFILPNVVD